MADIFDQAAQSSTSQGDIFDQAAATPQSRPGSVEHLTQLAEGMGKSLFQVSTPGIAISMLKQHAPDVAAYLPKSLLDSAADLKDLPNKIGAAGVTMFAGGEEGGPSPARAVQPAARAAAKGVVDTGIADRIMEVAKRGIVNNAMRHIPGAQTINDAVYILTGHGVDTAPPVPKPPNLPTPQADFTPGPPELWGRSLSDLSSLRSPVTAKQVSSAVDQSLNVSPLKKDMPLRDQIPAKAQPVSQGKVESSVINSYRYDPTGRELHITTKSNPNTTYVYGDVDPEQAQVFHDAPSKGKAWAQFKQGSSPLVAKIVNGKRVPVRPVISDEDLTGQLMESLNQVKARKASTTQ